MGIAHHVARGEHEGLVSRMKGLFKYLETFRQRGLQQRDPVFVEDVEDEGLQRQLLGQSFDPVFAPPTRRFLKGQEFLGGGVVGQGLRVQNGTLR